MDSKTRERCETRAAIFKALAHPSRVFIIEELAKRERCVCDLQAMIGSDISTVSKHLSVLKHAGLVSDDRRGAQVFYRLATPCVLNFMGCVESVCQARRERLGAVAAV